MKAPYFKFYIKDFAFETNGMTDAQVGRLIKEVIKTYRTEEIPESFRDFSVFSWLFSANSDFDASCERNKQNRNKSNTYVDQSLTSGAPVVDQSLTTLVNQNQNQNQNQNKEKENIKEKEYAFKGNVIKLNQKDFDRWKDIFWSIPDLKAKLTSLDIWFVDTPSAQNSWFVKTSCMLEKQHNENIRANPKLRKPEYFTDENGQTWKINEKGEKIKIVEYKRVNVGDFKTDEDFWAWASGISKEEMEKFNKEESERREKELENAGT